jgi:hypothetical protein
MLIAEVRPAFFRRPAEHHAVQSTGVHPPDPVR